MLNDHLARHPWLVNDTLTIADISVAPSLMYAEAAHFPMPGYDHIAAWFDTIQALPA